ARAGRPGIRLGEHPALRQPGDHPPGHLSVLGEAEGREVLGFAHREAGAGGVDQEEATLGEQRAGTRRACVSRPGILRRGLIRAVSRPRILAAILAVGAGLISRTVTRCVTSSVSRPISGPGTLPVACL